MHNNDYDGTLEIRIPFEGFYESTHGQVFDDFLERELELLESEKGVPLEKCQELSESFYKSIPFNKVRYAYSVRYLSDFNDFLKDELGQKVELKFSRLYSPREYNFETDSLFALIAESDLKKIFSKIESKNWIKYVEEKCTSKSGFISYYSPDFNDWESSFEDWGACRLGMILECFLLQNEGYFQGKKHEDIIYEKLTANNLMESFLCNGGIDALIFQDDTEFSRLFNELEGVSQ